MRPDSFFQRWRKNVPVFLKFLLTDFYQDMFYQIDLGDLRVILNNHIHLYLNHFLSYVHLKYSQNAVSTAFTFSKLYIIKASAAVTKKPRWGGGTCNLIIEMVRTLPLSGCCFCFVFLLQSSALISGTPYIGQRNADTGGWWTHTHAASPVSFKQCWSNERSYRKPTFRVPGSKAPYTDPDHPQPPPKFKRGSL